MIRITALFTLLVAAYFATLPGTARASNCYAFVEGVPGVRYASLDGPALAAGSDEISITYVGHSAFRIESAGGVVIVTDYFGAAGAGRLPDVVTMNKAHETHYTDFPDPAIPHVLRGWNPEGGPAEHRLELGDVVIRNVTTDIRTWGGREKDGNSIFVFEIADMCIGHLGHLHHSLTEAHYALLGRLDIVMAPVDGSFTLEIGEMIGLLKTLKARLVLPMHAFGQYSLDRFLLGMKDEFDISFSESRQITVSLETLPSRPTVMVLPSGYGLEFD